MNAADRERIYSETLVPALQAEDQIFVHRVADQYRLDFKQIRELATAARDLEMWREKPLASLWEEWEAETDDQPESRKQSLLARLDAHLHRLRTQPKVYPIDPLVGLSHAKPSLVVRPAPTRVFTLCPYFSEEANCCGLHTIEAATGCTLGCSFCSVRASLGEHVEFSVDLAARLAELELDPERFYHVSTGQSSDSLLWGNRLGCLDALFAFARRHPNVLLELKSKADRIDYLRRHEIPDNIICSWLLSTETIIRNEEHATATVHGRLHAARVLANKGCRIGLHIDPIVHYQGWEEDYMSLVGQALSLFSPEDLDFVSLGVAWFTQPVVREIRHRGGESKALQMPLVEDPKGKLTYPQETRIELYSTLYRALQPWHGKVFIYLCMETPTVWEAVLGESVSIAREMERVFRQRQQRPFAVTSSIAD